MACGGLDGICMSERVCREGENLMYRYFSGGGGWNEMAFFQGELATVNGGLMEPMTRTADLKGA